MSLDSPKYLNPMKFGREWVGSGLLNILPIHASGYHDSPPETALDPVISSYTPTVKSLAYARERAARVTQVALKEKAMVVAMPTTPEQEILPLVKTEVENVKILLSKASINATVIQNPTRMEVLSELWSYTIVHFACHGYSANDPSQSSLLLEDWKIVPLTVSDLTSFNVEEAKLAYLSACHTSTSRDIDLLDESISLTSAIQLSGYPSVVGTLWQVGDNSSAEVAGDIDKWNLDGNGGFNAWKSAEGLHKAVRNLRDKTRVSSRHGSDPLVWAPYIYVGI
jgi:CHAT domain-containing protein